MVKGDFVFPIPPTEEHFTSIPFSEKINEADVDVFDDTAMGSNLFEQAFNSEEVQGDAGSEGVAGVIGEIFDNVVQVGAIAHYAGTSLQEFGHEGANLFDDGIGFFERKVMGSHSHTG